MRRVLPDRSGHIETVAETRLGGRLCFRGPSGFELTEFGEHALRASIAACEALEMVRHELNGACNVLSGELRIGIADNCLSNPRCKLAEALTELRKGAPNVTLNVSIGMPKALVKDVLERRLHVAISANRPAIPVWITCRGSPRSSGSMPWLARDSLLRRCASRASP